MGFAALYPSYKLVLVEPLPVSSVLETASWNAGGPIEGSAVSHAESQFADWITGSQRDAAWHARVGPHPLIF